METVEEVLDAYDRALPDVYGYLHARCPEAAEDLTSETFLASIEAVRRGSGPHSTAYLIGIARHKLADHWRRTARRERGVVLLHPGPEDHDPWDLELDALRVRDVLLTLSDPHRHALLLRHVDGLPVPEVARLLGRTVHATEALLSRARVAFRAAYGEVR